MNVQFACREFSQDVDDKNNSKNGETKQIDIQSISMIRVILHEYNNETNNNRDYYFFPFLQKLEEATSQYC